MRIKTLEVVDEAGELMIVSEKTRAKIVRLLNTEAAQVPVEAFKSKRYRTRILQALLEVFPEGQNLTSLSSSSGLGTNAVANNWIPLSESGLVRCNYESIGRGRPKVILFITEKGAEAIGELSRMVEIEKNFSR